MKKNTECSYPRGLFSNQSLSPPSAKLSPQEDQSSFLFLSPVFSLSSSLNLLLQSAAPLLPFTSNSFRCSRTAHPSSSLAASLLLLPEKRLLLISRLRRKKKEEKKSKETLPCFAASGGGLQIVTKLLFIYNS